MQLLTHRKFRLSSKPTQQARSKRHQSLIVEAHLDF